MAFHVFKDSTKRLPVFAVTDMMLLRQPTIHVNYELLVECEGIEPSCPVRRTVLQTADHALWSTHSMKPDAGIEPALPHYECGVPPWN